MSRKRSNVLILSVSSKVLLVRSFRAAAAESGGIVVACDAVSDSAALFAADKAIIIPRSDSPDFGRVLLAICNEYEIGLVVPTRDGELEKIENESAYLRASGAFILVPPPDSLKICRDKRRFAEFCIGIGLPVAPAILPGEIPQSYPVFVRPRTGAGGIGARRIDTLDAYRKLRLEDDSVIVQEFVADQEYTIDVLMDLQGNPLQAVVRSRLCIQNGESKKSRVEDIKELEVGALQICAALKLVGHNLVQAFYSPANGANYIEVNPRFGGASNLSIAAGLDSPRRILQMMRGEEEAKRKRPIRQGLTMLRYNDDMLLDSTKFDSLLRTL